MSQSPLAASTSVTSAGERPGRGPQSRLAKPKCPYRRARWTGSESPLTSRAPAAPQCRLTKPKCPCESCALLCPGGRHGSPLSPVLQPDKPKVPLRRPKCPYLGTHRGTFQRLERQKHGAGPLHPSAGAQLGHLFVPFLITFQKSYPSIEGPLRLSRLGHLFVPITSLNFDLCDQCRVEAGPGTPV